MIAVAAKGGAPRACRHGQTVGADFCVLCLRQRIDHLERNLAAADKWIAEAGSFIEAALPKLREVLHSKKPCATPLRRRRRRRS
jgi:hypothetical protein